MERKLEYSFDDEIANKFCYDTDNKKIEIHFAGFFDLLTTQYVDKPCIWVIENWVDAKSKLSSENSFTDLEKHLGIISMVLSAQIDNDILELTANTIDDRYIDLLFTNAQLKLL